MIKRCLAVGNTKLSPPQKIVFFESLRRLIGILFAVVIAFGFEQFNSPTTPVYVHSVALIVIGLSWWGYYWGITCGPKELNVFNILVDCALLVIYWMLLNKPQYNEWLYPAMFFLYTIWELIRYATEEDPAEKSLLLKASICNGFFTIVFICIFYRIKTAGLTVLSDQRMIAIILLVASVVYRVAIHKIYTKPPKIINKRLFPTEKTLIKEAKKVAKNAFIPLSAYAVGAAILTDNGRIYTGCNVEFANLSNTIHAEEAALSKMVSAGDLNPAIIAVYTTGKTPAYPCGMCLQSLYELGGKELVVVACNDNESSMSTTSELLPEGFSLESIEI